MQLAGKKVVVVGGSSGIGLSTAELARREGADVNPSGAGVWELPGLGQSKAGIGTRYQPA